ncbi:hypothetical protein PV396_16815 [Streptomyces sp. ME02-8801-2C]|uniref:hypothetical protein n=1 Tax=Streptomyces sp. ME02-8801-2C TaxID=3028680 RepID=UPI0029BF1FDC|nr:hypothetical protein [Streptomyces sp. ME02-8801-2C]MDX3453593.1 hypothetical protein [Streptomyces sp. ME02-8801-2C]
MPSQQSEPPDDRLTRLRGPRPPQPYTARKITALTANPACARRAVLDAAGVDKALLAQQVGYEPRFGQSPFALAREQAFHSLVKWGGYAELIRLLREELSVPVAEAHIEDLNEVGGNRSLPVRERETRRLIAHVASGQDVRLILDRPVLTLEVAGRTAYLEPDALTHRVDGRFYVVLIRSFAAIDGQANPTAVAQAAKQAAVYVLALRRAFDAAGLPAEQLAHDFLLVCPKDFSNRPYGRLIDLRQELDALQFQLTRLRRAEDLAAQLPETATLDPDRSLTELSSSIEALDASYAPACLSFCEMARYCRDEADGCASPARLGSAVRNDLPGIDSTRTALDYLDGVAAPGEAETEAADLLRAAARLRQLRRRTA